MSKNSEKIEKALDIGIKVAEELGENLFSFEHTEKAATALASILNSINAMVRTSHEISKDNQSEEQEEKTNTTKKTTADIIRISQEARTKS